MGKWNPDSDADAVVLRHVGAVVGRLHASRGLHAPGACHQVVHAVEFAMKGAPNYRDDAAVLHVRPDDALALVRALIPYVEAACTRPIPEDWPESPRA